MWPGCGTELGKWAMHQGTGSNLPTSTIHPRTQGYTKHDHTGRREAGWQSQWAWTCCQQEEATPSPLLSSWKSTGSTSIHFCRSADMKLLLKCLPWFQMALYKTRMDKNPPVHTNWLNDRWQLTKPDIIPQPIGSQNMTGLWIYLNIHEIPKLLKVN